MVQMMIIPQFPCFDQNLFSDHSSHSCKDSGPETMPHFPISLKINGMIARKLLTPEPLAGCRTLRFSDHTS